MTIHSKRIAKDYDNISFHYDVSSDFYRLFLGETMCYSCGYFETDQDDLDKAQSQKLDLICKKLMLSKGERFLDIGCGWGGLVIWAASRYGVHATGITLSKSQADFAGKMIKAKGLSDKCKIMVTDYRELTNQYYDKIASVGMFEHVGKRNYEEYLRSILSLLPEQGLFLNHGITSKHSWSRRSSARFINDYIFPGGELHPLSDFLTVAEHTGFEIHDVEGMRSHYALTLKRWADSLEKAKDRALEIVDEKTYRAWILYITASAIAFEDGANRIYQVLMSKQQLSGPHRLPITRRHLLSIFER